MLPGESAILWLPFYGTPSSYKGGTEGSHPSRFPHLNHQQTLTAIAFGSSGHYIGQENSRPRFGIIMTHLCSTTLSNLTSVVGCLVATRRRFEISSPGIPELDLDLGFAPEVVVRTVIVSLNINLLRCYPEDGFVSLCTLLMYPLCGSHYKECSLWCTAVHVPDELEPLFCLLSPSF